MLVSLTIGFFVVKNKVQGTEPNIAGNKIYIILSGSMSPEFSAGSVVDIKAIEPEKITSGDIITFKDPRNSNNIITHRVVEINKDNKGLEFITKGDANNEKDIDPVPAQNVIGKEKFSIPYLGYILQFIKNTNIIILILIITGACVALNQFGKLIKKANVYYMKKKKEKTEDL
jgi:signal peptidase